MAKIKIEQREGPGQTLLLFCPGCKHLHAIYVDVPGKPSWTWNGSMDSPTVSPSLLTWTPDYDLNAEGDKLVKVSEKKLDVCHSFVRDGKIQFLGDCDHALKNQTVDLPDFESTVEE